MKLISWDDVEPWFDKFDELDANHDGRLSEADLVLIESEVDTHTFDLKVH